MIDLETLAASCATMADEIVARGSSDTFRYDADGILEFGDSPEYYSPISSSAYRSEYPETAREYGYTREYLEQARAMTASASTRSTSTRSCYAPAPPRPTRTDARRSRPPSRATSTWTASKATSTAPWPTWTTTT